MKVLGIGNAIVDVICKVEDKFITQNNLTKSTMKLVDENEFKRLNQANKNKDFGTILEMADEYDVPIESSEFMMLEMAKQNKSIITLFDWCEIYLERIPSFLVTKTDVIRGILNSEKNIEMRIKRLGDFILSLLLLIISFPTKISFSPVSRTYNNFFRLFIAIHGQCAQLIQVAPFPAVGASIRILFFAASFILWKIPLSVATINFFASILFLIRIS